MNWFYEFHYLESWSLFMLVENRENHENSWKWWKCMPEGKMAANSMLKSGYYAYELLRMGFQRKKKRGI